MAFIPSVFFYDISFLCSFLLSHPLYFSYFIFFSPYLFRFISFISPLFLTTSLLLTLSLIASSLPLSKLGFVQTIQSKMSHDVENHYEFRDFEDLEIYKLVFDGPPLLTVGDGDREDEHVAVAVRVTESEEERSLERLFEELDRFEASTAVIEIEEAAGELLKIPAVMSPISGEDQETDDDSSSVEMNMWRLDSSSGFGSCGSTTASSPMEEVAGELQKLEPVKVSSSGEDQKTAKSISMAEIEMNCERRSHVRELLQIYQSVTSSISDEYLDSVQKPFFEKSKSTAAIEINNNETMSHVRGVVQKTEPVTSSISGDKIKSVSVESKSMPASEMKNNETASHVHEVIKKLEPVTSAVSGEDQKTVKSHSSAATEMKNNKTTSHVHRVFQNSSPVTSSISGEDHKTVKSHSSAAIEMKNNKTTSHVHRVFQNSSPVTSSISGEVQKSVRSPLNSWRLDSSTSFGSYGSMRKEKEWKRTLACKLFEERNNSEGGEEGMDSLWEAYEDDNSRKSKNRKEAVVNKNKKKSEFKYFDDGEDEEDDDEDDEMMSNGQLCCLKALKLSTGKMNLGMGKPNLVKITKALKGFGWLHHVGNKRGKKH